MAKSGYTFSAATTPVQKKAEGSAKAVPQAYIFIGRDKFRSDERSPQDWRKLFVVLSRMARNGGNEVSQNEFGLGIVYDALTEIEAEAKKQLKGDYDAAVEKHWNDAQAEDAQRAAAAAKRAAAGDKEASDLVEKKLEESVKQTARKTK
jgi:hypothetical protein